MKKEEKTEKTKKSKKVPSLPMVRIKSYILIKRLGYGSFGEIYQAVHHHTNEIVALKIEKKHSKFP